MKTNNPVDLVIDEPGAHYVEFDRDVSTRLVEGALPDGWAVLWGTAVTLKCGRRRRVRIERR